jgi:hypothetical protein
VNSKSFGQATTTVSVSFISHLRLTFDPALDDIISKNLHTATPPRYASPALVLPCYLAAVAAVESAMNELFFTDSHEITWGITPPPNYDADKAQKLEHLSPVKKLLTLPAMFFGKSLSDAASPITEMKALVGIRHELVH